MFDNLTKEIIYYSLIPATVLALITLLFLIIKKKKKLYYKYNYIIKTLILLIDGIVLSIIIGYSVWATARFINNNSLSSNVIYVLIFLLLIISLISIFIVTCYKLYMSFNISYDNWSEEKN